MKPPDMRVILFYRTLLHYRSNILGAVSYYRFLYEFKKVVIEFRENIFS